MLPSVPFRSHSQKIDTDEDLYAAGLRALMRRAYSIHEMKEYLGRRAADKSGVTVVITRLRDQGYLDDAKYARDYARLHANSRRQGKFRIARELRARGVPDRHIDTALESVFAETDETTLIRERIRRKLSQLRGSPGKTVDQKKIASLCRNLMAAGFSADVIRTEIRNATKVDAAQFSTDEQ
jgi:regulatory protein